MSGPGNDHGSKTKDRGRRLKMGRSTQGLWFISINNFVPLFFSFYDDLDFKDTN